VYAFYNAAYYQNKAINTPGMVVQGLGVGLNIQSKSSIFTISYARGISAGNRFLLNKAKIHFGYINTF
jgi:hypothetical protein